MKRKIVFGSIIAIFILMSLPSISAIEYQKMNEEVKSKLINSIKIINQEDKDEKNDLPLSELKCIFFIIRQIRRILRFLSLFTFLMPYFVYVIWACILWIIF
jgi:hypothetical protein